MSKPVVGFCRPCERAFLLPENKRCPFCDKEDQVAVVPADSDEEQVRQIFVYLLATTKNLAYFVGQDNLPNADLPEWVREEIAIKRRDNPGRRLLDDVFKVSKENKQG